MIVERGKRERGNGSPLEILLSGVTFKKICRNLNKKARLRQIFR